MDVQSLPDLEALVDPLIGEPYAKYNCWALVRELYQRGWGEALDASPSLAWRHVEEIWWQEDTRDPLEVSQPWDLWILRGLGMASHHVGIVVNQERFVHTGERQGVCQPRLMVWQPRLLQIARLRRLL